MYYLPYYYPYPAYTHPPTCSCGRQHRHQPFEQTMNHDLPVNYPPEEHLNRVKFNDHGKEPFVINIERAAERNSTFRTALWTGEHLQVTLMSINVGEDIGLEVHPDTDQFLRIEEGQGIVQMGDTRSNLYYEKSVAEDDAIMVPAGKWHNLTNTGDKPLKLYSIYAPPEHPFGTVHETKADDIAAEGSH